MRFFRAFAKTSFVILALIGLAFVGVFVSMQFGWTNVRGTIAERNNSFFKNIPKTASANSNSSQAVILCKVHALANFAPQTAQNIENAYQQTNDGSLASAMFSVAALRFAGTSLQSNFDMCATATVPDLTPVTQTAYAWADSAEWGVMKSAFVRDQDTINRAARDAGISPRLLLGGIIGEQFRFFTSERDSFKQYFEPLKVLASLSKFSYGIAGLKPETAQLIEDHLHDSTSVFYLGSEMENVIAYPDGSDHDTVRFDRITDTKNTYYSYLYAGLFMREVTNQWKAAGYDIAERPDALSTLYNLGFNRSIPKPDPAAGGAPITVNGQLYNFGDLGYQFYYSGELIQEFPYVSSSPSQ
ncbi:MAG: hypothetical protein JWM20_122 [Patescibacteria group bacterium]|nr:hypothetical protein [Patescibacteria group bacterium]